MQRGDPDYTIHLGNVYYVGNTTEVRENFLGEKTSPYAPVKWPMGSKGGFALNGNHGNVRRRQWLLANDFSQEMGLTKRGAEWGSGQWASFCCLENDHWRIIGLDTGYNSTRFDCAKLPLVQRSKWLRRTTAFKPGCALPDPLLAWLRQW